MDLRPPGTAFSVVLQRVDRVLRSPLADTTAPTPLQGWSRAEATMAHMPCLGQAHPLPGALHPAPAPSSFGRQLSGVRRLGLGRRAEQSRRLAPCGAWAGESWSRAFAAARSRARQFLHDQQQHFQREDADDAASSQTQPVSSADQHSSRASGSRPTARTAAGDQIPEGDSAREHAISSAAQPHEAAAQPLSAEDAEWEGWKAVRDFVSLSAAIVRQGAFHHVLTCMSLPQATALLMLICSSFLPQCWPCAVTKSHS